MPLTHDIRIAIRRLGARPADALLVVATVALGIGAASAVFSVVDQTVLRPAPFPYADRLVDASTSTEHRVGADPRSQRRRS